MRAPRCLFASVWVWLLLSPPAFAGAPELNETCRDQSGARVPIQLSVSTRFFAEAKAGRARESQSRANTGMYVIYINPERTYLGRPTQQWLYLRQCAHIRERHPVVNSESQRGLNIKDEEMADCWAARELMQSESSKILYVIESDMARLIRDGRWGEVLPGPERRISLSSCGK